MQSSNDIFVLDLRFNLHRVLLSDLENSRYAIICATEVSPVFATD